MQQQQVENRSGVLKARKTCSRFDLSGRRQIDVSGVMVAAWPTHFPYDDMSSVEVRNVAQFSYHCTEYVLQIGTAMLQLTLKKG